MASFVTVHHQDVCKGGFAQFSNIADAVFLDLPAPWEAVNSAKEVLKKDKPTRICCFSPCAEQVQKTCVALREAGFQEICMYETLTREHVVTRIEFKSDPCLQSKEAPLKDGEVIEVINEAKKANESNPAGMLVSRPSDGMRGHTSYLTFASLLPQHAP